MKHILLCALLGSIVSSLSAQEQQGQIDSIYYNKSGTAAQNPAFADYLRIAFYPADSTADKEFRDFYMTGRLRREGCFLQIDTLDDNRTKFDKANKSYYPNGHIREKMNYSNGLLEGEYKQYDETGKLRLEAFYLSGNLSGLHKTYQEDGSCRIIEYDSGQPIHDWYLLADQQGNMLKFRIADNSLVWETPAIAERGTDYWNGKPWEVYYKNGLTLALTSSVVRDYGKWHRIDLRLSNNSTSPIEFAPEINIKAYSVDKFNQTADLTVWPYDAYMKKVKRAQNWSAALMEISEGMAMAGAGYSTSTTYGYSSDGSYSTYYTTTYSPTAAYQANMASQQRIANFSQALQDERNVKEMGYLKKNTIYPGETISGFVHIEWKRGSRVVFVINIEGAEYLYEWTFDRKSTHPAGQ